MRDCSLPLTGERAVDRIFTDIAVIDVTPEGLVAREAVDGIAFDELQRRTGAPLGGREACRTLEVPELP